MRTLINDTSVMVVLDVNVQTLLAAEPLRMHICGIEDGRVFQVALGRLAVARP